MNPRISRLAAAVAAVFLLLGVAAPTAAADSGPRLEWLETANDVLAVTAALETHRGKVPAEFDERLRYVASDGTLNVMVSLWERDPSVEQFVEENTREVAWYGDDPRFFANITADQLAPLLNAHFVRFVEPDYPLIYFMSGSSLDVRGRSKGDGSAAWSFSRDGGKYGSLHSDIPGLSSEQVTGKGVTVAVTDSGIDRTHKDFGGFSCTPLPYLPCESRIAKSVAVDQVVRSGLDPSDNLPTTEFASGHGTHVAGTIAGNAFYTRDGERDPNLDDDGLVFGIAPQASLISVKNGDLLSAGLSSFALQWQLDNAAKYGIRVSSNSWGCLGGCPFNGNSAMAQILRDMYSRNIVVVFAVGNEGGDTAGTGFSGNAQSPYVLGTAAYDHRDDRLASFSSRGIGSALLSDPSTWTPESEGPNGVRRPDVAAPGVWIWSAASLTGGAASLIPRAGYTGDLTGGDGLIWAYVPMSGTSMATPHVAGAAAVLVGACPQARSLDVMRAIMAGANSGKVAKTDGSGRTAPYEVGYGALDVRASLDWPLAQPTCNASATPPAGGGTSAPPPSPSESPNAAPRAAISGPNDLRTQESGTFDGSQSSDSDGHLSSYEWDFGDGLTTTGAVVEHAFANAGTYEVTLTVTDDDGATSSVRHQVRVVARPGAIAGSVRGSNGRRINGALVDCGSAGRTRTNRVGRFVLRNAESGTYRCSATARGYRRMAKPVTVAEGQTATVTFRLRRR
ncbi:MAG: S8 family serine peptidase [Actinomycetota bacterium]|nr:S8 family serine peptidase [Actinomycetota bacterium]